MKRLKRLYRIITSQTISDLFWNFLSMCGYRPVMDMEGLREVKLPPFNEWFVGENWDKGYHPGNPRCYWIRPDRILNGLYYRPWYIPKYIDDRLIPYAVGKINTYPFAQKYGYWEIMCKIELQEGLRHAFWGWADKDKTGRERGYREIDIFEIDGKDPRQKINIHWGKRENGKSQQIGPIKLRTLKPGTWQRFGFYWTPEFMEWYVGDEDGMVGRVVRLTNSKLLKWFNENETAIWTLIDQSVIGAIDPIESGSMTVDYCAIYKLEDDGKGN